MRAVLDALLSVLVAAPCATCDQTLEHPTRGPVCEACWRSIRPLTPPLCDRCGDPLQTWRSMNLPLGRCPRCRRSSMHVDRARAIGGYEGTLRLVIHALKYEGRRSLAEPLASLMRERGANLITGADVAIPVPLHSSRRRERGFNQAADLAKHLGLPLEHGLRRIRATAAQAALPAGRRHSNVRGAFATAPGCLPLRDLTVLLVDDVSTTGATLEACARVLKEGGAREVRAITAARVVALEATARRP